MNTIVIKSILLSLLLCTFLMIGCSKKSEYMSTNIYPWLVSGDGDFIAWNDTFLPKTNIYRIRSSERSIIGQFPTPGYQNVIATDHQFLTLKRISERKNSVLMYDLLYNTVQPIFSGQVKFFSDYASSYSPVAKSLLLRTLNFKGMAVLNVYTEQIQKVLASENILNATWIYSSKDIMVAIDGASHDNYVKVLRLSFPDYHPLPKSTYMLSSLVRNISCSPDGNHIVFVNGGRLVCQNLHTGKQWLGPDKWAANDQFGSFYWNVNGSKCAFIVGSGQDVFVTYDVSTHRTISMRMNDKYISSIIGWSASDTIYYSYSDVKANQVYINRVRL